MRSGEVMPPDIAQNLKETYSKIRIVLIRFTIHTHKER